MPLNKTEQQFFDLLIKHESENPSKPPEEQSIDEFREGVLWLSEFVGQPEKVVTENRFIPARDGYQIPIRIFNADIKTPGPLLIMFPGGGYVIDTFKESAVTCTRIAKHSRQKVILVNYRLVPENPMPTPINDAFDVTEYVANHPDEFQLGPTKLAIGGLSAGAHCAAVISYLSEKNKKIEIHRQILLNGAYDALLDERNYAEYEAKDIMVSREGVRHIYKLWDVTGEQLHSPMYSPYYVEDVAQLPKTTILIGEFDGMRSDSEAYYKKLKSGGCRVSKIILPGQTHHTMLLRGVITDGEDPAKVIADILCEDVKTCEE